MESNPPDNFSRFGELLEGILTDGLWILHKYRFMGDLHGNIDGTTKSCSNVVQLLDDQQMAAPRRYFDPLRTGQFGPPCSRALYTSDLKLLVIVSRGACQAWIALELGLNFGEHIVDLDLFPVHPRTNKDDILINYGTYALQYANIIWNPISVFGWFAFTCVYPLVKRGNHLIITQDDGNEMTITSGQLTILPDRQVLHAASPTLTLASTVERVSELLDLHQELQLSSTPTVYPCAGSRARAITLVFNYTPELPPTSYEISFNLK
ncbi:hypothetical protein BU15DRAFT_68622 [Melanogaster broomeanus]|nr:hypothetical protein BU15DRAFT_68622 [Melanogaster broomeanus]